MSLSPGSASSPPPPWIQGTGTQHHDPHGLHTGRQPPGLVVVMQMSFLMKVTMIFMLVLAPEKCVLYGLVTMMHTDEGSSRSVGLRMIYTSTKTKSHFSFYLGSRQG